jgi:hypothetical protein
MLVSRQRRLGACKRDRHRTGREARQEEFQWLNSVIISRRSGSGTRADADIDEGLRAYMLRVYNLMAIGMVITGVARQWARSSLATTTDPSLAVATLPNGKMLTNMGYAVFRLSAALGRHAGAPLAAWCSS